jgi:methyltransferase family protein
MTETSAPLRSATYDIQPLRTALSAWSQHVPFAMYLVELLRPTSVVELGTRNGVSYCAFCQAIQHLGISAQCVAVDSWYGDAHTGAYGAEALANLRRHHDRLYAGFSRLRQCMFDDALREFADGGIDLLHIDGLHTYEAVRHDFESWLPKMSRRGVILFHDVEEHRGDFGAWMLWSELVQRYPSFTFRHGHGLGILGVGDSLPGPVLEVLQLPEHEARSFRRFFEHRGRISEARTVLELGLRFPIRLAEAATQLAARLNPKSELGD